MTQVLPFPASRPTMSRCSKSRGRHGRSRSSSRCTSADTWREWADALAARIAAAQATDDDVKDSYYRCWLAALEDLLAIKGIGSAAETARWRDAWQHAVNRTPHGRPIELRPNDFD